MPKRSDRAQFGDVFEGNPYDGVEPDSMYRDLQWGNEPNAVWEIDGPEPMVAIGELAGFDWGSEGLELWGEDEAPYLAVGRDSNALYVVPRDGDGPIDFVPPFDHADPDWRALGTVRQTDYYSSKGGDDAYYYHNHEAPYPTVWEHTTGVRVVVPARHKGRRSYAVGKAGIVG